MDVLMKNAHGTCPLPWKPKSITHKEGWMTTVIVGDDYKLAFANHEHITNISYSGSFYEFAPTEYVR